jgi:surface polysaccharide O-acyltransferase-like enzyme
MNRKDKGAERVLGLDLIRILAVFFVILGPHVAHQVTDSWGKVPTSSWLIGNFYDCLGRIGVPLFVLVSGSLLLSKDESLSSFFRKRFWRVGIPFIFWITVYVLWRVFYQHDMQSTLEWVREITKGPVYYHLWYLYMITGLYFVTPLLRRFIAKANKRDLMYFTVLWFLGFSLIPEATLLLRDYMYIPVTPPFGSMGTGYVWQIAAFGGYYVLGYVLSNQAYGKKDKILCGVLFVGSSLMTAYISSLTSFKSGFQSGVAYGEMFITVIIASLTCFVLVNSYARTLKVRLKPKMTALITLGSQVTFGIYLIHPIFIDLLKDGHFGFSLSALSFNPLFSIPVTALLVFCLSAVSSLVLHRVPILKRVI